MTSTAKPTVRRSVDPHPRHQRRIIATLGPGDVLGLRLEREKITRYLPLALLYDQAEVRHAASLAGFDPTPCTNPKRRL